MLTDSTGTICPSVASHFTSGEWVGNVSITRAQAGIVVTAQTGSVSGTSNGIDVNPNVLDHFTFSAIAAQQTAVEPFLVTITAFDFWNNAKTDYGDRPALVDTTGTILPAETVDGCFLSTGVCEQSVTVTRAQDDMRITVSDAGGFQSEATSLM